MAKLQTGKKFILQIVNGCISILQDYYKVLLKRHTSEGIKIHFNPIATDIALQIYENVDMHGEISNGKTAKEISPYSLKKAIIFAEAIKGKSTQLFIRDPHSFMNVFQNIFEDLWSIIEMMGEKFKDKFINIDKILNIKNDKEDNLDYLFQREISYLQDLNPNSIIFTDKTGLLSAEEKFILDFRNQTLNIIVQLISQTEVPAEELVGYILERKEELHKYFLEENSFYVCKIGTGNQFMGEAPGQLEVIPGKKPNINLDEIIGSGFDEVRQFISQIDSVGEWNDLFIATSPSKTADKTNMLLVGPQGCGKTQAMRAISSKRNVIAIFAQGSDFMTCWAGEAQKNPKRLFEAAIKLQKESGKHIYILVDEVDQVLHSDVTSGGAHFNLTREFQILMDGIVSYPNLSIWGATNHPERIPTPMMRRFSKVLIVGELDQNSRIQLLQHYCNFMPIQGFDNEIWNNLANKLDGATGDVVRKIVDSVWRSKMKGFVDAKPTKAKEFIKWLNEGSKFNISEFTNERRVNFKKLLGEHVQITPTDVDNSISDALNNFAILNEIKVAKATYTNAKTMISNLK